MSPSGMNRLDGLDIAMCGHTDDGWRARWCFRDGVTWALMESCHGA